MKPPINTPSSTVGSASPQNRPRSSAASSQSGNAAPSRENRGQTREHAPSRPPETGAAVRAGLDQVGDAHGQHTHPSHDQIAHRAQELWEKYNCPSGRDTEIWLEAERQLTESIGSRDLSRSH